MIGVVIVACSALAFVVGVGVVIWDWCVNSNPDAPHGGPIVAFAFVGLLCGGVVSCVEVVKEVQELKQQQKQVKP